MLTSVVGASAKSATIASVIAASGMASQSMVPPRKTRLSRFDPVGPEAHVGAARASSSAKATSPWIESRLRR
jgi:hypothetical protein